MDDKKDEHTAHSLASKITKALLKLKPADARKGKARARRTRIHPEK
jgi:hypothetical protein